MAKKRIFNKTGTHQLVSSGLHTSRLKTIAEKRGKRLYILRKFIEQTCLNPKNNDNQQKFEEFIQKIGIKSLTWNKLEEGESCLSLEVAEWLCIQVNEKFSVFVTTDWLLGDIETLDLPRLINKKPMDLYAYLSDLFKAETMYEKIEEKEKQIILDFWRSIEETQKSNGVDSFKEILDKYNEIFNNNKEKDLVYSILKQNKQLQVDEIEILTSICRRFINKKEVSTEENNTRNVLIGFFMSDLFQKTSPKSMVTYVRDNRMSPIFFKGEIVGGVIVPLSELEKVDKKECIVELANFVKIVRVIQYISPTQIITNTTSFDNSPELHDIKNIRSVAIIHFKYKNFERDGLNIDFGDDKTPKLIEFSDIFKKH